MVWMQGKGQLNRLLSNLADMLVVIVLEDDYIFKVMGQS